METDYYRNYIEMVEQGSISAAARKLNIAQPALSNQLKQLEKEYDTTLLIRGARKVELTEAGKVVYEKAQNIVELESQAKKEVTDCKEGQIGTLNLALPPSNNGEFLMNVLGLFSREYPGIHLNIYELLSKSVAMYVKDGIAEIGFVRAPLTGVEDFDFYPAQTENLRLIMNQEHPLAKYEKVPIHELDQCEVAISRSWTHTIESLSEKHHLQMIQKVITTSRTVAIELASQQNLVALVPTGDGDEIKEGMIMREIDGANTEVKRGFIVCKNRKLSKVAELFLDQYKENLG
ncbi:MAG: LysR family transcriptional regulator [Lachnospiraceae bacterium]|nr:LysR family transcriptional regulator [Lachnospiraceae bacterium]